MEEEKKETKTTQNKVATEGKKEEIKKETNKETKKQEPAKVTNKKVEPKKEGKKITKNNTIIFCIIAIIIVLAIILAYVFLMKDSPKKAVDTALTDLKTGNYAQEMLANIISEEDNFNEEAQKLLFEKLQWKVLNTKEEGDQATVEVEITNKDFKTIMGNYMQKALKAAFSQQNISQEEMTNYLIEELNNKEIQTVTSTQTITLEKQDGKWKITDQNSFANIVLPGLNEAISAFN